MNMSALKLTRLATLVRYYILRSTTKAGSGHPTTSLSATDLMTVLFFGGFFKADLKNPSDPNNDRLIFSKGHASPLFYALYAAAGVVSERELDSLRKFGSPLEGHPTMAFPYTEAATGSLGQGLSIGVGMALNAKYVDKLSYRTYVLLGDSEMSEGSVWEAMTVASYYKLDNLVAILDVNRLGQRGQTMYGHDLNVYEARTKAFGWDVRVIDGHNLEEITKAYQYTATVQDRPVMIIAKTLKGKGVSFIEDKDGWHGKALSQEEFEKGVLELGDINYTLRGTVVMPEGGGGQQAVEQEVPQPSYDLTKPIATRRAYGDALVRLFPKFPDMIVLDAEVSNSTYAEIFKKAYPKRFFEMYIMEQNMTGVALGFSRRGKIPFISTFAAFFSRAYDQIRMCQYSDANIKFVGSHAGVSIGEDGASQMGLEDLAMFRTLMGSVVLYPSDAYATERLVEEAAKQKGVVYIRTTRKDTPLLYGTEETFPIGGSKVLRSSDNDVATVVGAGVTLYEALSAYDALQKEDIAIRVVDLYSIKPLDVETLKKCASQTKALIAVEDHYPEGGIGEAVSGALIGMGTPVYSLAVRKMPRSGKPDELLAYEEINKDAIIKKVKEII
ncbi:transketolase, partial [Candidatus Uhrbacteria bacterium]|nr:transketolase [Candidatus Uhrbacteria bacterium]